MFVKSSASGFCVAFAWIFQFQPGVAYKSVAYKKNRVYAYWFGKKIHTLMFKVLKIFLYIRIYK